MRDQPLGLPDLDAGEYLIEALFDVGPLEYHATGEPVAVTWPTLWAYAQATGAIEEPWEYKALVQMSAAYVQAKRDGADPFCIPPTEQSDDFEE